MQQAHDLACSPSVDPPAPDPSTMPDHSSPIHHSSDSLLDENPPVVEKKGKDKVSASVKTSNGYVSGSTSTGVVARRERPSRACTQRAAARMQAAAEAEAAVAAKERKRQKAKRREKLAARLLKEVESEDDDEMVVGGNEENAEEDEEESESDLPLASNLQCSKIITPLVGEPEPSQLPRWNIRSMWQLASILNFLNVFRSLLNIKVEFSAEELESALINPNNTLADIHMPLLKAIPPVTRMALGHGTWVTVLCRKLRDWWHWVAEGDLPIVASHGTEVEAYGALEPSVRVVILKALCDIRVEQEDIRSYIDDAIKHGTQLSLFRKERIGGDPRGISYWYEDDPLIGHRLYREIRTVEVKKGKGKSIPPIPHSSYQWEAVATNFDEFINVSEKLFTSQNRTEVAVGKKLKNAMLPEIEKVHKRKEKLLKKQHRQALLLDGMMNMDGFNAAGRSLRDRKPVTYTFDDYDRSISEAINVTKKKQQSPEPSDRSDPNVKVEVSTNGRTGGPSRSSRNASFSALSPISSEEDEFQDDQKPEEALDRGNRQRQKPQRYSGKEFISDNDPDFESDDDIVGEVVYDDEYLSKRKHKRKMSSSSEGDEEYHWEGENQEEEEEEEDDEALSTSDDSDEPARPTRKFKIKTFSGRTRRETKLRSVDDFQTGLRRSNRATRNQIDYKQYEMSDSDTELTKPAKSNALDTQYNANENSQDSENVDERDFENVDEHDMEDDVHVNNNQQQAMEEQHEMMIDVKKTDPIEEQSSEDKIEGGSVKKRRFLDLNELAPGPGLDDGPNMMRDDDDNNDPF